MGVLARTGSRFVHMQRGYIVARGLYELPEKYKSFPRPRIGSHKKFKSVTFDFRPS